MSGRSNHGTESDCKQHVGTNRLTWSWLLSNPSNPSVSPENNPDMRISTTTAAHRPTSARIFVSFPDDEVDEVSSSVVWAAARTAIPAASAILLRPLARIIQRYWCVQTDCDSACSQPQYRKCRMQGAVARTWKCLSPRNQVQMLSLVDSQAWEGSKKADGCACAFVGPDCMSDHLGSEPGKGSLFRVVIECV